MELANNANAGGSYDTAVVVTKNNESTAKSSASELGQPTQKGAPMADVDSKVRNNGERYKRLSELFRNINNNGRMGAHQLLHEITVAFNTALPVVQAKKKSTDHSEYYEIGNGVTLRIADHQGSAKTFADRNNHSGNYGIVIKLSSHQFKDKDGVDYLEYVYYLDKLEDVDRQKGIVSGFREFVATGDFSKLPTPDRVNPSGAFKEKMSGKNDNSKPTRLHVDVADDLGDAADTARRIAWEDGRKRREAEVRGTDEQGGDRMAMGRRGGIGKKTRSKS